MKTTDIFAPQLQLSASIVLQRQPQSQALGTSLGTRMWAHRGARLGGAHGQAAQGSGELGSNTASVFLGQVLMIPGG